MSNVVTVRCVLMSVAVVGWVAALARAAQEPAPPPRTLPEMDQAAHDWLNSEGSAAFGKWLSKTLEQDPGHPEWLDMYADILQGSQLGPRDGWFRRAVAQSRFDGPSLVAKYDKDGDYAISRNEFTGASEDFRRLDRNGDGILRGEDIVWPEHALAPSPGSSLYFEADADSDGRVSRDEFLSFFDRTDTGKLGFLSLDDLKSVLPMPGSQRPTARPAEMSEGPSKATLVRGLFQQEIGSMQAGPNVGEAAPPFTLQTADGRETVSLVDQLGQKPVVLVFGNITCGPFRSQAGNVEKLYERYRDRANFLMVYVREAHPTDGWRMNSNDRYEVRLDQPKNYEERAGIAQSCQSKLGFDMPFLVDTMDDAVGSVYSGMPSRLYVIDTDGKVAYKSGRGPFGFKTGEMEQALIWTLTAQADEAKMEAIAAAAAATVEEASKDEAKAAEPSTDESPAADDEDKQTEAAPRVPLLDHGDAYGRLAIVRDNAAPVVPTLPIWARALAAPLPRATAAMLALDQAHRDHSPLSPRLRAAVRWMVARANRSPYGQATAELDLRRAGVDQSEINALRSSDKSGFNEIERDALNFADQMTTDASAATDEQVARLIGTLGRERTVALVLLIAYGNFQDRLLLSLGIVHEPEGALPALAVALDRSAMVDVPERVRPATADDAPPGPSRIDDPEWLGLDMEELQAELEGQKAREGRIPVPTWEQVIAQLPPGAASPANPVRIQWSLVCMGYQPGLASAWGAATGAFAADARQDRVFEESLFWVVTRTIHCFY